MFCALATMFFGCGTAFYHPLRTHDARHGEPTALTPVIRSLPEPKEPLIVAVYSFRDQTGQYKLQEGGSGFSTAVTQGAANILIKVLQDSKWFVPIERENISDLLNERKIIRSTRQQFGLNEELPGLLYAGVLLEGGIVSYDANVVTGGVGLRYFGTGGGSQYRQDRVTVYLRATSVTNGKILKTVYASKMILSQSVDGGVFRYVKFRRLLEAETGFTYNEPSEMAVTEAIEMAVESLVFEGVADDLWMLKDGGKKKELLDSYKAAKEMDEKTDVLNQLVDDRRRAVALSLTSSKLLYRGDFARPKMNTSVETGLGWVRSPYKSFQLRLGVGSLGTASGFKTGVTFGELGYTYRSTPFYRFTPIMQMGIGVIHSDVASRVFPKAQLGAGMEWMLNKNIGFQAAFDYHYVFSDLLDNREHGRYSDAYWRGGIGLNFYFGKKVKNKKRIPTGNGVAKPKGPLQDF